MVPSGKIGTDQHMSGHEICVNYPKEAKTKIKISKLHNMWNSDNYSQLEAAKEKKNIRKRKKKFVAHRGARTPDH